MIMNCIPAQLAAVPSIAIASPPGRDGYPHELVLGICSILGIEEIYSMEEVVKKEAYIAVPGIGMISLGKINLDDLKMDMVVKHLVENYFSLKILRKEYGVEFVQLVIQDFTLIYSAFLEVDYFKSRRKQKEKEELKKTDQKWKVRMKILSGIDLALQDSSLDLDRFAWNIYNNIRGLEKNEKNLMIPKEIERILSLNFEEQV